MGSRGPIPKRDAERRRRNKPERATDTVTATGPVPIPPCPSGLHPEARRWYRSLRTSAQTCFFEPSDWAQARVLAVVLSQLLSGRRLSAQLFAAWCSAAAELGVTEGARRRLRIEVERSHNGEMAEVTDIDAYRLAHGG